MADWRGACVEHAKAHGIATEVLRLLDAFGPARVDAPDVSFAALVADADAGSEARATEIALRLGSEVDADQAALFGRRFDALDGLLARLARDLPAAEVLRVGLHQRLDDVLSAPPPHAVRIRALVDFYTSHAAALHHARHAPPRSLADAASTARWRTVARGVQHGIITGPGPAGPLHVNVLVARRARLRALDLHRSGVGLIDATLDHGAIAGVSGGFFLYSEADIQPPSRRRDPVGMLVSDGHVVAPPVFRRATLFQRADGSVHIDRVGLTDWVLSDRVVALRVVHVGAPDTPMPGGREAVALGVNRAGATRVPEDGTHHVVVIGNAVVHVGTGPTDVPLNGVVLRVADAELVPQIGTVHWLPPVSVRDAMAGGPALLGPSALDLAAEEFAATAPPITFSADETFDQNLLPRMAAGLRPDGSAVFVAVDGRNFERAPGLTLTQTAELCAALGCVQAMNLDGGSSKRMVVEGRIVDLPSTDLIVQESDMADIRPVHTAILIEPTDA